MDTRNKEIKEMEEKDKAVLQSTLSIINNILLRNNLNMRGVILDADDEIAVDSKDSYEDLASGRAFVRTR